MENSNNWPFDNVYKAVNSDNENSENTVNSVKNPTILRNEHIVKDKIQTNSSKLTFKIVGFLALLGLSTGVLGGLAVNYNTPNQGITQNMVVTQTSQNNILPGSLAELAAKIQPGVVNVNTSNTGEYSSGSGFIVTETGYLITNHHVIEVALETKKVQVIMEDGEELVGDIVGSSKGYDVAVIKLPEGRVYPTLEIANSDNLQIGELVVVAGSPLGLQGTFTQGIISSTTRAVTSGSGEDIVFANAIQTDAAINPGNSGGPLVNTAGAVIGVNSAIVTTSQDSGSIGLGFAIPINTVMRVFEEIVQTGKTQAPIIGVNLDLNYAGKGVKVENVTVGGPAEKYGLDKNDVITKIDGELVKTPTDLIVKIRDKNPGDYASLEILRNGTVLNLEVQTEGQYEN